MIVGVGTDIVLISRIQRSLNRFGDRFAERILSDDELVEFKQAKLPEYFLAKRFAAKEAVSKALGTGMRQGVSFRTISIGHDQAGKPNIVVSDGSAAIADALGVVRWHLSLSDEREHALAFVVAER